MVQEVWPALQAPRLGEGLLLQVVGLPWGEGHTMLASCRERTLPLCDSVDKAQDGPAAPCLLPPRLQVPPEVREREPGEGDEL